MPGQIPGIRAVQRGPYEILVSTRNGKLCEPQIIVNGIVNQRFDRNSVSASEIIGVEYYTVATTPLRFNVTGTGTKGAQCGTAIFWLK
ncbi:MAG: hypothetical protein NTX19_12285 [Gemmatimonadetes bacterium]|nr:hypothetical protein [Gemmatimonadota bacterium]